MKITDLGRYALVICATVALLPACSSGGSSQVAPSVVTQVSRSPALSTEARSSADSVIYIANRPYRANGNVAVLDTKSGKIVRNITNGVGFSVALAVDSTGNLYVANRKGSSVTVYASNTSTPALTIKQGIVKPLGLQFDPAGELNVLNVSSVTVYPPSSATLLRRVSNKLTRALAMTFDLSGNLFVLNQNKKQQETDIVEYAAGSTKVRRTFTEGSQFAYANDVVIGPDGYLYIAADISVIVLDPATGSNVRTITEGVYGVSTMAFDSAGNLYLANSGVSKGIISVYAPEASAPSDEISENSLFANALLFDQKNDLYVVGPGKIDEFAPGDSNPKRSMENGLAYPWAAVFGQ